MWPESFTIMGYERVNIPLFWRRLKVPRMRKNETVERHCSKNASFCWTKTSRNNGTAETKHMRHEFYELDTEVRDHGHRVVILPLPVEQRWRRNKYRVTWQRKHGIKAASSRRIPAWDSVPDTQDPLVNRSWDKKSWSPTFLAQRYPRQKYATVHAVLMWDSNQVSSFDFLFYSP